MPAIRLGTVAYVAGAQAAPFEITTPLPMDSIEFKCTGVATVGVAPATLVEDGVLNLIRRIQITKGGSVEQNVGFNERFGAAGKLLQALMRLWYGQTPVENQPAVAIGANAFDFSLVVPLAWSKILHKSVEPRSSLDMGCMRRDGQRVDAVIDFGADADALTPGGGGTAVITNMQVEIIAHVRPELQRVAADHINRYHRLASESVAVGAGALAADQQRLNQAVGMSPGFLVLAVDNDLRDPDYINRLRVLINATDLRFDASWDAIVAQTRELAGLQVAMPAGFGWVDFDSARDVGGYLPLGAKDIASAILELDHDATAGGNLRVYATHAFLP